MKSIAVEYLVYVFILFLNRFLQSHFFVIIECGEHFVHGKFNENNFHLLILHFPLFISSFYIYIYIYILCFSSHFFSYLSFQSYARRRRISRSYQLVGDNHLVLYGVSHLRRGGGGHDAARSRNINAINYVAAADNGIDCMHLHRALVAVKNKCIEFEKLSV
jgi:hypothetical protein